MPSSSRPRERSSAETQRLHDIIDSMTPERLRALLKDLSDKTTDNWEYISHELMVCPGALKRARSVDHKQNRDTKSSGQELVSDYSDKASGAPATRQRFEVCEQCDKEYDALQNNDKSCTWHEGDLDVDDEGDFWADHDENCHGEIDTPEMREEYPKGFMWSCCNKPGDASGCSTGRHMPDRAKRVRR